MFTLKSLPMNKMLKKPAYSLLYALFITTIILIVAATAIEDTTQKILLFQELESGAKARLAAESVTDEAIRAMKNQEAGYELQRSGVLAGEGEYGSDGIDGSFEIFGRAQENDNEASGYFYTPIPNTGTAGPSSKCSFLEPDKNVGHACNWNKLLTGDSVTIPLYSDDGFGGVKNPNDLGVTAWYLLVRTPCDNGSLLNDCGPGSRYVLDAGAGYEDDDSIILWQLIGESSTGSVSVVPDDATTVDGGTFQQIRFTDFNTEVYESSINSALTAGDYIALEGSTSSTKYQSLLDFSKISTFDTVVLQLDIVSELISDTGVNVPYLEWQLYSNALEPFADNKSVIFGEGFFSGTFNNYYFPHVLTRSTIGERTSIYTLSN